MVEKTQIKEKFIRKRVKSIALHQRHYLATVEILFTKYYIGNKVVIFSKYIRQNY